MITPEELEKYQNECIRIYKTEITKVWEVARMNSKDFPDGTYRMVFTTKEEAIEWVKKSGWKLWGYWEE